MNKFNKLYDLIIESILTQNKASRAQMLAKLQNHQQIENYLNTLQNKVADFLAKFFKSGQLKDIKDKRIQQIINILKRNTSFNIQQKISLDQFLKQNEQYIKRQQNKEKSKDLISYIDNNVSQFYNKQTFDKGVVVYKVKDTRKGQQAVRNIIDMQWRKEANPWCLAARQDGTLKKAWGFWIHTYTKYPKQIAFQNDQLLAFRAEHFNSSIDSWWNRKDKSTRKLRLLDGKTLINIPVPEWTKEDLKYKQQGLKQEYTFNKETQRYDVEYDLTVNPDELVNGHFALPLGVIKGDFMCDKCYDKLLSLQNGPTRVEGEFNIRNCSQLTSLQGAPQYVGGRFRLARNYKLKDSKGFPKYVGGEIDIEDLPEQFTNSKEYQNYGKSYIKTFIKENNLILNKQTNKYDCNENVTIPKDSPLIQGGHLVIPFGTVKGDFNINFTSIVDFTNCPERVEGDFYAEVLMKLKSIKGSPKYVGGKYNIGSSYMTSLVGAPKYVGGDFDCNECHNLQTLDGLQNTIIKGSFHGRHNNKLTSLIGVPKEIGGGFDIYGCLYLTSLQGAPKKVGKEFNIGYCKKLTSLKGGPQWVGSYYTCAMCDKIKSLEGLPKYIGKNIEYIFCGKEFKKKDIPAYVKFGKN